MRAVGGAAVYAVHHCTIVAKEQYSESTPAVAPVVAPGSGCQGDGVQFLELNASARLCWRPTAIEPVTFTEGAEANGNRAVCVQVEVWSWGPLG